MVAAALETSRANNLVHTVAYLDLDHFKEVNDRFGHEVGDRFLRDVAHRMALNVRGNDVLARLGGDEFALLLHECTPHNAQRVADKVREAVSAVPAELDGVSIAVGASVGLAVLDRFSDSAEAALAAADAACYAAKAAGRNTVVVTADADRA